MDFSSSFLLGGGGGGGAGVQGVGSPKTEPYLNQSKYKLELTKGNLLPHEI